MQILDYVLSLHNHLNSPYPPVWMRLWKKVLYCLKCVSSCEPFHLQQLWSKWTQARWSQLEDEHLEQTPKMCTQGLLRLHKEISEFLASQTYPVDKWHSMTSVIPKKGSSHFCLVCHAKNANIQKYKLSITNLNALNSLGQKIIHTLFLLFKACDFKKWQFILYSLACQKKKYILFNNRQVPWFNNFLSFRVKQSNLRLSIDK